ncbi:hypothetical protein LINGRAHAP2_LOCUS34371, partial [Linum grandiflorum]
SSRGIDLKASASTSRRASNHASRGLNSKDWVKFI